MNDPRDVEVYQQSTSPVVAFLLFILGVILLVLVVAGLVAAWPTFIAASSLLVKVLVVLTTIAVPATLMGVGVQKGYLALKQMKLADLAVRQAEEELHARQDERRRANERHALDLYLARTRLPADALGNRSFIYDPESHQVIEVSGGNVVQPVPHTYAPRFEVKDAAARGPEDQGEPRLLTAGEVHIPSFAELLAAGEIGPGQRDILFSFELVRDDVTGQIGLSPIRGAIGEQHTQLIIAGSQSGKTTYMAHTMGQAAALRTLFYLIDPHRQHPEKSLSAKVRALSPWFIVPPAMTHDEIRRLLAHATRVRDARIGGKQTPYDGYHLMVVVDEVPALMALHKSSDKDLRLLYLDLARFMQSLGSQTTKFGMTGLFASQFATKEALGEIDFRDACMSQLIMRLHPTQAQALRILGPDAVRAIPTFPKGHGFLLLSDATEVRRVASGNATAADLAHLAAMLPPSPLVKTGVKTDRNPSENRSIIPMQRAAQPPGFGGETTAKAGGKQVGNHIEPTIQARLDELGISGEYLLHKVDQVTPLLGQNKAEIMRAVWGVSPGKGKAYEEADSEYDLVLAIIRSHQLQLRYGKEA
jgi:hypothetical protein